MSLLTEKTNLAGSEGTGSATVDPASREAVVAPDPEVSEQAKRRRFTAEYKLRILREADACKGDGDVAALLRREGLYSSLLSSWRRQRDEIAGIGLAAIKRGRKGKVEDPRVKELARENTRLKRRLARVETMLEIQKKASELLGIPLNPPDNDEND
jgi:transposase-like protein